MTFPSCTTEQILDLHRQNLTCSEIAERLEMSSNAVYRRLYKRGIKSNVNRCKFDDDFFRTIDSECKAYWLGFIYADGCVIRKSYNYGGRIKKTEALRVGLSAKDREHLVLFLTDIQSSNVISDCSDGSCRISLNSHEMVEDLIQLGCVERKSHLLFGLPNIPSQLLRHFVRGYFDGDGCICYQGNNARLSILGTKSFLSAVRNFFGRCGVEFTPPHKQSRANIFVLEGNGNQKAKAFYNLLYTDASRFLSRKEERFHAVL